MPLFVRQATASMPTCARRVVGEGARQFERVDDTERAVQPAAMRLGFAVRADQK